MRFVRDWIASAAPAALAAALAVVVIGAGLFGFAVAELTSDSADSSTAPAAPAVVGGSGQPGSSTLPAVIASVPSRAEAVRLARKKRAGGARVRIVPFRGSWLVVSQSSQ